MKIIHLSAECYPVAKVGGLADVVGALPKYLADRGGVSASVVMPKYDNEWIASHRFETVYEAKAPLGEWPFNFRIQQEADQSLGFPLYVVDIPDLFDRAGIYSDMHSGVAFGDNFERFLSFQLAVLDWVMMMEHQPQIIHCHDHHTGLLPFLLTQSYRYRDIKHIPTVLTVHNGEYQGVFDHDKQKLLPQYNRTNWGLLDWDGQLNCLAAGLKTCWRITTVSPSYMQELSHDSHGLEWLFKNEEQKSRGIINGIDREVWNPATDAMIDYHYDDTTLSVGKAENKQSLCGMFGLDPQAPLISFIGRLAYEKGADLLPDLVQHFLESSQSVNFIVLGTGDRSLHHQFKSLNDQYKGYFKAVLDYNEPLAHQIYAGSDFMFMPSRVEPCGLNQMYAMRYGTLPIVRRVGGLKDTVIDLEESGGYGVTFDDFALLPAEEAVQRAINLFDQKQKMDNIREKIMNLDFSWNASAKEYLKLYRELLD